MPQPHVHDDVDTAPQLATSTDPPQFADQSGLGSPRRQSLAAKAAAHIHLVCSVAIAAFVVSPLAPNQTPRLALLLPVGALFIAQAVILKRKSNALRTAVGPPPIETAKPSRPCGLKPPALHLPPKPDVPLTLPPEPPESLPGHWTHCNNCGRPLYDATSAYRGVGPDCYRRTRIYYPSGPPNPQHLEWEAEVERLTQEHQANLATAVIAHAAAVRMARQKHARAVGLWELDVATRDELQAQYDVALTAWRGHHAHHIAATRKWSTDPRHGAAQLCDQYRVLATLCVPALIAAALLGPA
ncbi:DUF6011 domain-containing protein [Actinotalea solisilvae]|uniref:DUF6011 domain-containing protein n=1 Tax=Actinotalea solisilvae TaxID=2072922 RepID=UPI0018F19D50|nr:DUF6011 domain-containing protein [Actinotalea solisilvae]